VTGFVADTNDGHKVGLDATGVLWFDSCCDADRVQLTVEQVRQLRRTVNAFLSRRTGRTCTVCGKDFWGEGARCRLCRMKPKNCANCGVEMRRTNRLCSRCYREDRRLAAQ
jgi:hypothetical protein